MTITSAKLSQLTRWEGNPRKPEPVKPELKANIAAKGVLQPLICRPNGKNTYEVIAGGNRLEILQELVAEGVWPKDRDIPISVGLNSKVTIRPRSTWPSPRTCVCPCTP